MHTTSPTLPLSHGVWTLDAAHSTIEFTIRHLGISTVRGRFGRFDAQLSVGETLAATTLVATIDTASVDTGNADRDDHLRGADFLDVAGHPQIAFISTSIIDDGSGRYRVNGTLTVNGVSRPETLTVTFDGTATYPIDGSTHAGFTAVGAISRRDYGVSFNVPLDGGGFVIGDRVSIALDVQLRGPAS
jgi:polyisoprenoid-binding protein YceI